MIAIINGEVVPTRWQSREEIEAEQWAKAFIRQVKLDIKRARMNEERERGAPFKRIRVHLIPDD